jgi:hypothetical protein
MAGAGWYADPDLGDRLRWWDGQAWTAWVSAGGRTWAEPIRGYPPLAVATPAPLPQPQSHPQPPSHPQQTYPQPQPYAQSQPYAQAPPVYPQQTVAYPSAPPAGYVTGAGGVPGERFRSLKGLSVAILVLFIVAALFYGLLSVFLFSRAETVSGLRDGGFVPAADLTAADDSVAGAYGFALFCEIALFVLLIVWLWRAYSNTRLFGAGPWRWGRGWTVGAWFIPLANLVIPKLLINDAWRGADPRAEGNPGWRKLPVAGVVTTWWILLAAGRVLLQVTDALYTLPDASVDDLVRIDLVGGLIALLCLAGSILGAIATWKLSRWQHDRAAELGLV